MSLARALALLCAAVLVVSTRPAWGFHTVFHFHVDRFEADGNVFGPADGTPDYVDEFDGTSLGLWTKWYGTASVSEGLLHLQNPGDHYSAGFPVDISEVASTNGIAIGGGTATVTSYWMPPALTPGSSMHMTLVLTSQTLDRNQVVGIHVQQIGDAAPIVGFHALDRIGDAWTPIQLQSVPYDASAVTDRLVLRLVVDADTVSAAISLDGGTTFATPFDGVAIEPSMSAATVLLGADPWQPEIAGCGNAVVDPGEACDLGLGQNGHGCCTDTCTLVDADGDGICDPQDICPQNADPTQQDSDGDGIGDACDPCTTTADGQRRWSHPLVALGHLNDGRTGNESLRMAGSFTLPADAAAIDPTATGAHVTVTSARDGSTVTIDLPAGAYAAPGPGWQTTSDGVAFVDRRPGGTHGVRKMTVHRAGARMRFALSAPRGAFELGPWTFPPINAAVSFGDAPGACAEVRFDQRECAYPASRRIVCR